MKEKIVLKDGTVYDIENGAAENLVQIPVQSIYEFPEIYNKFTEENLESYTIQSADGLTCATYKNKKLNKADVKWQTPDIMISLYIADVDMVRKQLKALEAKVEVHDGAISDLGESVSGLAEEGGFA